jgi:predicted RNA-binding protein with PUA-like domain
MDDVNYWIVNTNREYSPNGLDENDMLKEKKCAAYGDSKEGIKNLKKGDVVFLYRSKDYEKSYGIIAFGEADGNLNKRDFYDPNEKKKYEDFEYNMKLNNFNELKEPLEYSDINNITHKPDPLWLRDPIVSIDTESGMKIKNLLLNIKRRL